MSQRIEHLAEGVTLCLPFQWTDERVGLLKKLWLEGVRTQQIATALGGGVTGNAVIGKANRLGLGLHPGKFAGRPAKVKPFITRKFCTISTTPLWPDQLERPAPAQQEVLAL